MSKIDRLTEDCHWIDLEFINRERIPEQIVEVDIQLHLAVLSLQSTKQYIEQLGVEHSRTAIHNWVKKGRSTADRDASLELYCGRRDCNSARY